MTAQAPEKLTSDHADIDFAGLQLYQVVSEFSVSDRRGKPYPLAQRPREDSGAVSSALWRGHIGCYRLTREGRLQLEAFEYPTRNGVTRESASETLRGEFWLVLGHSFFDPRTYVPFRDGTIVADRREWIRDERPSTSLERTHQR